MCRDKKGGTNRKTTNKREQRHFKRVEIESLYDNSKCKD